MYFNPEIAKLIGIDEAVMLENIHFWVKKNRANGRNIIHGRAWTYNSMAAFSELFPFWSEKQIRRILNSLKDRGLIQTGCFNKEKRDRTLWYTVTEAGFLLFQNGEMQLPKRDDTLDQTGKCTFDQMGEPLPDIKLPDINSYIPPISPKGDECVVLENEDLERGEESEPKTEPSPKPKDYPADFQAFWQVYPAKVAKKAAFEAFKKAKKQASAETITDGARRYAEWLPKKQAQRPDFPVKYPQGWLNDKRWEDVLEPVKAPMTAASVTANSNWEGVKSGIVSWADYAKK